MPSRIWSRGKGKGWVSKVEGEGVEAIEKVRISKYDQYVSTVTTENILPFPLSSSTYPSYLYDAHKRQSTDGFGLGWVVPIPYPYRKGFCKIKACNGIQARVTGPVQPSTTSTVNSPSRNFPAIESPLHTCKIIKKN
jgi:hypothetical protein